MSTAGQPWDGFIADRIRSLSPEELRIFAHKRILITGAGGYLGSALARELARLPLQRLVLLDTAEYGLYRLDQDLQEMGNAPEAVFLVGSVCDGPLVREIFKTHAPHIIFHAAALKHVPLMETNAMAAARTNVLGTETVLAAAARSRTERFLLLSTDKAVDPISVMGATKRVAECLTLAAREDGVGRTAFTALRLCNVLGSTGSVAPLFARQIARGGPVTVTDSRASRYFLSVHDAVQCLLQAAVHASEMGLAVPGAGPARTITDLATYLNERLRPGAPAEVIYTGLRAADKLHERFVAHDESLRATEAGAPLIPVDSSSLSRPSLDGLLREIRSAVDTRNLDLLKLALHRATGASADQRESSRQREMCP